MAETLTEAIEQAVEKIPMPGQDLSEQVAPVKETETKTEVKESTKESEEAPLDLDAENGRTLIQALRDPERAAVVIDFLAKQAGYTKGELASATKTEVKEAGTDITKILEEELGDEFKFLAPKFGKALDRYLKNLQVDDSRTATLEARIENAERREIEVEVSRAHTNLAQTYFGSDEMPENVVTEMSRAMDKFPATDPKQTPSDYYNDVFIYVVGKLGLQKKSATRSERIERNRADAPARNLSATNRGITAGPNGSRPRKMGLRDAVELAVEQVESATRK